MIARRLTIFATLIAVAALAPPASAGSLDATTAKRRACGKVQSTSVYRYARVVAIRRVSCRTARRVVKAYDNRGQTLGAWRCGLAHGDRPRLFSCGAGKGHGDLRRFPRALEAIGTNSQYSAAALRCGSVSYGGRAYVLYYRGPTCRSARRKVRHVHRHRRLRGWRCSSGSRFRTGGYCERGRSYFGWHPGD